MDIEELVASIDIVEYISQFVDLVEKNGEWWGLSCFKDENTPSFSVRKNPPFFYDYSSGKGGNVISFVKEYFSCSSHEAIQKLKKFAGVDGVSGVTSMRLAATADCQKYKRKKKSVDNSKSTVLKSNYMSRYEYRADKLKTWIDEGMSEDTLKRFQVKYDSFSNCIVYPIKDLDGNIVNIGGRTLYEDWKDRDLRKYTYFFPWGKGGMKVLGCLYDNLEYILDKKEVIIFEGYKSVLLAYTWGIKNTCCLMTSHLSPRQMAILAKLGVRVVFALDKEVKIRNDENISRLKNYVNVEYICDMKDLIGEKDSPADKGKEVFEELYKNRFRYR